MQSSELKSMPFPNALALLALAESYGIEPRAEADPAALIEAITQRARARVSRATIDVRTLERLRDWVTAETGSVSRSAAA